MEPLIGVIMGSTSDWETMIHACEILDELGIPYEKKVVSAHRTPDYMFEYAESARNRGLKVIIAGAGGAAHLPGMVAAKTTVPVIGVPVQSKALNGLDSLLSIVQMPGGVPVATVAIGKAGATNAGLLAAQIVSTGDNNLAEKLDNRREELRLKVLESSDELGYNKRIMPGATIGIIGGGQLGRMMAIEARQLGYRIAVLDPTKDCPCGQLADIEITASYDDLDAIKRLAEISDVITYEFENIDYEALLWLEENAYLPQKSELLLLTQDRETEKAAIKRAGCEVAPYQIIHNEDELKGAVAEIGYPSVLKTCRGGYDGKGQVVLRTEQALMEAKELLLNGTCILEKWVPFEKEISVIVTRSVNGDTKTFPVAENIHKDNILYQSIVPARVSEEILERAKQLAIKLSNSFELVGTLAVEMFLTQDGEIYTNELAPRPHNSGHYTIDLCETNQFEQHVRAICNLPLGKTTLRQSGMMVNLLGEDLAIVTDHTSLLERAKLHLYGKKEPALKRKMGHITIMSDSLEEEIEAVNQIWGLK